MPRPLPAHLASAMMLWASSRAALPSLSAGLPLSNLSPNLHALGSEIAKAGLDRVASALDRELLRRAERFLVGLETYRHHPYRRTETPAHTLWQEGATRLLDYGATGRPVLLIPSLINRHYILDLLPERSFAAFLRDVGLRPLAVDWGRPGEAERGFGLDDYIAGRLDRMLMAIGEGPIAILGYCMGGLLALALALRRMNDIAGLALLATPWDFHAERPVQARLLGTVIELAASSGDMLPLAVIQGLFLSLDPFLGERKFARFAQLDPAAEEARNFVALEDWLNDGVPLARKVARECGASWYRDNEPGQVRWQVEGQAVDPRGFNRPALVVVPGRDRIVPPRSAAALGAALPDAAILRPPLGHIGMMASAAAPDLVWPSIASWLHSCFNNTKSPFRGATLSRIRNP
jgi:poly[(R)-3-hydroxyalkanoate] polymerase subunit PhaC